MQQADAAFTVAGKTYPAGSYIVKTDQAFRPHVLDMFEPQDHPNDFQYPGGPPIAPYMTRPDGRWLTRWAYNSIACWMVLTAPSIPFPMASSNPPKALSAAAGSGAIKGYLLDARANQSYTAANDLLAAGLEVYRTTTAIPGAAPGSFYVAASTAAKLSLQQDAAKLGISVRTTSQQPTGLQKIQPARIALLDTYGGSQPSGWIRWMARTIPFPH